MNVGNHVLRVNGNQMGVYREFRLKVDGEGYKWGGDGTHVEHMENPVKIQLPRGNRLFVVLREGLAGRSAQHLDVPLDRGHSPTIEGMVSKLGIIPIYAGTAHVVNCSMASSTDGLS